MSGFAAAATTSSFGSNPQTEECAICVETLAPSLSGGESPAVCILANAPNDQRVCEHYYHRDCAALLRKKECPLCKKSFRHLVDMPSPVDDANEWYRLADHDKKPKLSKRETLNALKATLPLDYAHLEEQVESRWQQWDPDNSGDISLEEFKAPSGLLRYVLTHFQRHEPYLCQAGCGNQLCEGGGGVAMLVSSSKHRVCHHLFHSNCVQLGTSSIPKNCPICNVEYCGTMTLPNPRDDPAGFFEACDFNRDGELSKAEVVEVLRATCPINWRSFQAEIDGDSSELWQQFDHDNDGNVSKDEFICHGGLLDYVLSHYPTSSGSSNPIPRIIPHNRSSYNEYFDYWDMPVNGGDGNGELDKIEMRRAIIKTFRQWHFNSDGLDDTIETFFVILDPNGDGKISREEFLENDGWGDTIAATLEQQAPNY